ncbi:MAG: protein kinase [Chloroflexota bacterium]|nr:protein kinase [Chloroflexota bacterium]
MYEFLPIGYMLRGRYRVLKIIGGGGMGAVYKAEDVKYNSTAVAVKEMRTDLEAQSPQPANSSPNIEEERQREREERRQLLEAFRREAQILSDLDHRNLPRVTDFFTEGGRPYLVMELIPGESLEKKLDRLHGQPMDEAEALKYGIQVCEVLKFLHTQDPPIIFRDVKPANIMIVPNGQIKLIDFGIARTYKEGKRRDTMSMGTAAYAPFEQFGKGQTDARSDIYSLAATLYHLLTGRPPTPATTPTSLRDYNPQVSRPTEALIIKSMARDMNSRPHSADDMVAALRECLGVPYDDPYDAKAPDMEIPALPSARPQSQPAMTHISSGPSRSSQPEIVPLAAQSSNGGTPAVPIRSIIESGEMVSAAVAAAQAYASGPMGSGPASLDATSGPIHSGPITSPGMHTPPPLEERTCMVCGTVNKNKAHFCGRCGASMAGRPAGKLQVIGPNGVLWERRILENPFNIGRRSLSRQIFPHLDLTYNDPAAYVSRQHAKIVADAGGYFVEDLGSANGTFLNERRLPANVPTRLRNGDHVRIGKVQLNFLLGS